MSILMSATIYKSSLQAEMFLKLHELSSFYDEVNYVTFFPREKVSMMTVDELLQVCRETDSLILMNRLVVESGDVQGGINLPPATSYGAQVLFLKKKAVQPC